MKVKKKNNLKVGVIFYHSNITNLYPLEWIEECFNSIVNQTYSEFSIYELNYGDDDFRLSRMFDFDKEYHYYNDKFSNHADAMNYILNKAIEDGCDYVFNTNMDDNYHPDRFKIQLSNALKGYDIVSSNFIYIDENGEKKKEFIFSNIDIKEELDKDHNVIAHPVVCYSKNFITNNKYESNRIPREDLDMWKNTIDKYQFYICEEFLLNYRIHQNQVSGKNKKEKISKIKPRNIGLLIIATNKYIDFIQPLISSADEYFLTNHKVKYFVFTNEDVKIETNRDYQIIKVEHKDWPWMTMGRYHIFYNNRNILSKMDYLYYCDVDMKFENVVGDEVIGDLVATLHPGFYERQKVGTPERNPISTAYISENEDNLYYAGGFNGGKSSNFLKMSKILSKNIDKDLSNDIIAIWHDESHLNKYFHYIKPSIILSSSYCYPENKKIPFDRKLVALDKNHNLLREIEKEKEESDEKEKLIDDKKEILVEDIYVPPPIIRPTVCRCGTPIDRVRYNFCQKCGNLY